MYIVSISFVGAFPDGDKIVEVSMPSGGGGSGYMIMVDKFYLGRLHHQLGGWRVSLQVPNDQYTAGDLQPLLELVNEQTIK